MRFSKYSNPARKHKKHHMSRTDADILATRSMMIDRKLGYSVSVSTYDHISDTLCGKQSRNIEEVEKMSKWTMDTFGSMLPANWEEICEAANDYMDENGYTEKDSAELWERWCNEDADILRIIPEAVFEEEEA